MRHVITLLLIALNLEMLMAQGPDMGAEDLLFKNFDTICKKKAAIHHIGYAAFFLMISDTAYAVSESIMVHSGELQRL